MKKIRITEETFNRIERNKYNNQSFDMLESLLDEDYPSSWDKETFKGMHSFKKRVAYCQEHLQRISSGSARIVYKIDDLKVLKLAKNTKGIAQNDVEVDASDDSYLSDILATVFDYDSHDLWLEMELARKVTKSIFKTSKGFSFDDYSNMLKQSKIQNNPNQFRDLQDYNFTSEIDEDTIDLIWEDELFTSINDYMINYNIPFGDLTKASSYGTVKRSHGDDIVLIDYGLTKDVYDSYYS